MTKHTPGPWVISSQGNRVITPDHGPDYEIASCTGIDSGHPCPSSEMIKANTQLIAAAPELLWLCETSLTYLKLDKYLTKEELMTELEKTIKKARGE